MSVTSNPTQRLPLRQVMPEFLSSPSIHIVAPPVPPNSNQFSIEMLMWLASVLVTLSKSVENAGTATVEGARPSPDTVTGSRLNPDTVTRRIAKNALFVMDPFNILTMFPFFGEFADLARKSIQACCVASGQGTVTYLLRNICVPRFLRHDPMVYMCSE